ncbi:unnamed protein product, partial [Vitis vinifera]
MINPKKLIRMARKWQKVAALGRKRISLERINRGNCKQQSAPYQPLMMYYNSQHPHLCWSFARRSFSSQLQLPSATSLPF